LYPQIEIVKALMEPPCCWTWYRAVARAKEHINQHRHVCQEKLERRLAQKRARVDLSDEEVIHRTHVCMLCIQPDSCAF
jgi:hypothetical protein